jgi:protein-tyrosine phosphatase
MNVRVTREACCAADDQLGPLDAEYVVEGDSPFSDLIAQIRASGFLQFSPTRDRITGAVGGRLLVEVHPLGGPAPEFHIDASASVRAVLGEQTLCFRFRPTDTWWIDEPYLLGSGNPAVTDLEQLQRQGFGVLISLLVETKQSPRYDVDRASALGFVRHNIPVEDFCAPTVEQLEQFAALISGLPPEVRTVVHCEGGRGRTGTFAAAHWVTKGLTASEAIEHVRKVRRHAVETREQEAAVREFAARRTRPV